MFLEQPGIFTEDQIAHFLTNITDPVERAEKAQWFREFGQAAAQMNEVFPADGVQHGMEPKRSGEENG